MGLIFNHEIFIEYQTNDYQIIEMSNNKGGGEFIVQHKVNNQWVNLHENIINLNDRQQANNVIIDIETKRFNEYIKKEINPTWMDIF